MAGNQDREQRNGTRKDLKVKSTATKDRSCHHPVAQRTNSDLLSMTSAHSSSARKHQAAPVSISRSFSYHPLPSYFPTLSPNIFHSQHLLLSFPDLILKVLKSSHISKISFMPFWFWNAVPSLLSWRNLTYSLRPCSDDTSSRKLFLLSTRNQGQNQPLSVLYPHSPSLTWCCRILEGWSVFLLNVGSFWAGTRPYWSHGTKHRPCFRGNGQGLFSERTFKHLCWANNMGAMKRRKTGSIRLPCCVPVSPPSSWRLWALFALILLLCCLLLFQQANPIMFYLFHYTEAV